MVMVEKLGLQDELMVDKFGLEVGSRRTVSASPVKRSHFVMIISLAGLIVGLVKET